MRRSTDPMIRGVAFDFDGVLVESVDLKGAAFVALFQEHGPEVAQRVLAHHLTNQGMSRYDKIEHYYREFLHAPLAESELARLADAFAELVVGQVAAAPMVPGAEAALDYCVRAGLLRFIVSATPEDEVRQIVSRRGMASRFHGIYGSPTDKHTLLKTILASHDLSPGELLFVGDALSDHDAALRAGVAFVARDRGVPKWHDLGVPSIADLSGLRIHIESLEASAS